jgi:hypothetical protein
VWILIFSVCNVFLNIYIYILHVHFVCKKMTSYAKRFGQTEVGRKESKWRESIAKTTSSEALEIRSMALASDNSSDGDRRREGQHKPSTSRTPPPQNHFRVIHDDRDNEVTVKKAAVQEKGHNDGSGSSGQPLESNYHSYLNNGEHLGGECILNGTPMDSTVMACGDVTCFILTRTDLISLINETNINEHIRLKSDFLEARSNSSGRDRSAGRVNSGGRTNNFNHLGSYVVGQSRVCM